MTVNDHKLARNSKMVGPFFTWLFLGGASSAALGHQLTPSHGHLIKERQITVIWTLGGATLDSDFIFAHFPVWEIEY